MSGVAPERGAIWVTPHGVRMLMPNKDAAKPHIRLDSTLAGKRTQRTAGRAENWQDAGPLHRESTRRSPPSWQAPMANRSR
jgi:hypothetical protein